VFVTFEGYMLNGAGVKANSIITAIGDKQTPTLEEFEKAIVSFPDKTKVPVHYYAANDRNQSRVGVMVIDRWSQEARCWTMNNKTGK
jgi:hypothetical protein